VLMALTPLKAGRGEGGGALRTGNQGRAGWRGGRRRPNSATARSESGDAGGGR
jgi:hypothetical protein